MKRTYAFILAGSLMAATALSGCSNESTTGVETETDATEAEEIEDNTMDETMTDTSMHNAHGDSTGMMDTTNH